MQSETRKQKVGLHMSLMTKSDADDADDYTYISGQLQVHSKYQYCSLKAHRGLIFISENI